MNDLHLQGPEVIIIAILVLALGNLLTQKIAPLKKYSIPMAVSGGLVCSVVVLIIGQFGGPKISFDMQIRDMLLLVFFSTIGLSAKFSRLAAGGKALAVLTCCAGVFLVLQNITGITLAHLFGVHPAMGLFAGSIALAGGHGTAIAWGQEAAGAGLPEAQLTGIAFATFGLVAGGIIGGPVAEALIKRHKLETPGVGTGKFKPVDGPGEEESEPLTPFSLERALGILFVLAVCVSLGSVVNHLLDARGVKVPGFLTAMMVGILITNLRDKTGRPLKQGDYDKTGEVCLQLFLAMSLMSMDLSSLAGQFGVIFLVLSVQIVVITLFASLVIFRLMGKNYDAAVICGGFCGLGMGATPVAIANMSSVTRKHGASFKAFLVVPLVGAFFVDILNAMNIKFFLGLPFMQVKAAAESAMAWL